MKVAVMPGDDGGCGTYRLIEPAAAIQAVRPDWQITVYPPKGVVQVGLDRDGRVVAVENFKQWPDLLVMQRTGTPVLAGVAKFMQSKGVAVLVDFDDAMWRIDRQNVAWAAWNNPNRHRGQHWAWCDQVAEFADLVTVTTNALGRRYGRHGRLEVLPNRIPDRWVTDHPLPIEPVAGWAGYTSTHPGDCEVSAPAARVFAQHGKLRVVADAEGASKAWGGLPVEALDSQPLGPAYYKALNQVGVMLVGLRETGFNQAKSTLKVLEAAAAGIPAIASATEPHRMLEREGFPVLLASHPGMWEYHARKLLDPETRAQQTLDVRKALPNFTIGAQAERWAQAWERAANRGRKIR